MHVLQDMVRQEAVYFKPIREKGLSSPCENATLRAMPPGNISEQAILLQVGAFE